MQAPFPSPFRLPLEKISLSPEQEEERASEGRTSIAMGLFGNLIVGVTVRINRAIQLLKRYQSRDKFIVCL